MCCDRIWIPHQILSPPFTQIRTLACLLTKLFSPQKSLRSPPLPHSDTPHYTSTVLGPTRLRLDQSPEETEQPKTNIDGNKHMHLCQLTHDKEGKAMQWGEDSLFKKECWSENSLRIHTILALTSERVLIDALAPSLHSFWSYFSTDLQ